MPPQKLRDFFGAVEKVYVVEEASDFYDRGVRALGLAPTPWPNGLPGAFELSPALIRTALGLPVASNPAAEAAAASVAVSYTHLVKLCYKKLDKAVAKGVIHKNQASNRKSGVAKLANKIAA